MQNKVVFYFILSCALIVLASFVEFSLSDICESPFDNYATSSDLRSESDEESNPAFESFLSNFLAQTFSGKNFDSLVCVSSPQILKFTDAKNLGFGRFWNMGIYCSLYDSENFGYDFYDEFFGEAMPQMGNLKYFADKSPEDGFCEEATSPDGIYYEIASELPEDYDIENDQPIPAPAKLNNLKKMRVNIQHNLWVIQSLYFVEFNSKWYLLYIDDCDCGA